MTGLTRRAVLAAPALAAPAALRAQGLERFTYGTNWIAQAEHGGFYQALADGTYRAHGLDVEIVPGGPGVNNRALLAAGRLDAYMGGSLLQAFAAVAEGVPTVVVAAFFQRDPQALLAHPGQGVERFEDLRRIPLMISRTGEATFYRWLVAAHGFRPEQVRPYAFSAAPFCADPRIGMQGYVTAEPFAIRRACGVEPKVFLLADHGYSTVSTTVEVRRETLARREDAVRRFVEASALGWRAYAEGDPAAGNALIKRANPEASDAQLAFSIDAMRGFGLVSGGAAARLGVGAIPEDKVRDFHAAMARAGLVPPTLDWRAAYDDRFVNRGPGR
jgi:NitT/TauT family transport system substrate-binding protein